MSSHLQSCISRASSYPEDKLRDAQMSFLSDIRKHESLKTISENPLTITVITTTKTKSELIEAMKGFDI
jgi:hypothetical protein